MKKYLVIIPLLSVFAFFTSHAQDSYKASTDSLEILIKLFQQSCATGNKNGEIKAKEVGLISLGSFKKLMHNRFSTVVLENEGIPNEISSASFKISDDKLKFTLNSALIGKKGKSILSFGIASDVAGNSSVVYSSGKWNTAFSANGRLSLLLGNKLFYTCTEKTKKLRDNREKLLKHGQAMLLNDSLKKKYAEKYIEGITAELNTTYNTSPTAAYDEDSSKKIKALTEEMDKWNKYISEHPGSKKLFANFLDSVFTVETKSEPWNAVRLIWFSAYGSIKPTKYNLYNQGSNNLVTDSAFNGFKLGIDFNFLHDYTDNFYQNKPRYTRHLRALKIYSRYHSLRFEVNKTNNTLFYDTAQVVNKEGNKVKAVSYLPDSTYRTLYEASFIIRNILYFGSNKSWGIELTPRYTIRHKDYYNSLDFDAGLVFQLKDRDKEKSKVNFEILFSWFDVTNEYKDNFPVEPDNFKISFVGGIPLSTIFKGLF